MVLQRDRPVPIWGWADPMPPVTVTLDKDMPLMALADATGRW
jgi:sialate O-acetylesterase